MIAQLPHVYTNVGSSFPSNQRPSHPYSDMSSDIQIILFSEPAGFPGHKMRDCIQVFSLQIAWWPEPYWLKSLHSALFMSSYALKPEPHWPCCLDLGFLLLKFIQDGLQDSPLISGLVFCAPLIYMGLICITEKNSPHPYFECAHNWVHSIWCEFCGRKRRQFPRISCAFASRGVTRIFSLFVRFVFKINSGVFILSHVLLYLWWFAQNT